MTKNHIIKFLSSHKTEIQARFKVSKIGLFGSYATNKNTDDSDIDILVSMPSDFDLYYDLKLYLETAFHKKIDLGLEKNLRELIKKNINNEVLYV